jgi:hypothetical protein
MRKSLLALLIIIFSFNNVMAIDLVPSSLNLRFSNSSPSQSFTVSLSDDVSSLAGKSGILKFKLKYNKKLFSASSTTVTIPYEDGELQASAPITFTLLNPDAITKYTTSPYSVLVSSSVKKKLGINTFRGDLNIDAGALRLSGQVKLPNGKSSIQSNLARVKNKSLVSRILAKKFSYRSHPNSFLSARKINKNEETTDDVNIEQPVSLYEVDPEGNPVGEPIVTGMTDAKGEFELELPPEYGSEIFGTNYALFVEPDSQSPLKSFIQPGENTLNPANDAVFDTVNDLDNEGEIDKEHVTSTEFAFMSDIFEKFNPANQADVDDTDEYLKDTFGTVLENISFVAADDDSTGEQTELGLIANDLDGDYYVTFFDAGLSGTDGSPTQISSQISLGEGRIGKPNEIGVLPITPVPGFSTRASLNDLSGVDMGDGDLPPDDNGGFPPGGQLPPDGELPDDLPDDIPDDVIPHPGPMACFDLQAQTRFPSPAEMEEFKKEINIYFTANSDGSITAVEAAQEQEFKDFLGTVVFRSRDTVYQFKPFGEGMFLSTSLKGGQAFLKDTLEILTEEFTLGFASFIKQSEIGFEDIAGNFGLVGVGYNLSSSGGTAVNMPSGTFSIDTSGLITVAIGDSILEKQALNSGTGSCGTEYSISSKSDPVKDSTAQLEIEDGKLKFDFVDNPGQLFEGYARSDGQLLVFVQNIDMEAQGAIINPYGPPKKGISIGHSNKSYMVAVKTGTTAPNLAGKSFRILSYAIGINADGGTSYTSSDIGTLSFTATTASFSGITATQVLKASADSSDLPQLSSIEGPSGSGTYSVSDSGAITFTLNDKVYSGYVSADGETLVLGEKGNDSFGIYVGTVE